MAPIGKFSGVTKTGFSRVDNILTTNIAGIDDTSLVLEEIVEAHLNYDFIEDRGWRTLWRPSNPIQNPNYALNFDTTFGISQLAIQSAWVNGRPLPTGDGGDLIVSNDDAPKYRGIANVIPRTVPVITSITLSQLPICVLYNKSIIPIIENVIISGRPGILPCSLYIDPSNKYKIVKEWKMALLEKYVRFSLVNNVGKAKILHVES